MAYISEMDLFRDMNKNPDRYNIHIDEETRREIDAERKSKPEIASGEGNTEKLGPVAANYHEVIKAVTDFSLKPDCPENDPENRILSERKKVILGLLRQVIGDVERYTAVVTNFNIIFNSHNDRKDQDEYLDDMRDVDTERRAIHNRLISDLKILIRNINVNFNADFDPQLRLEAERKMPDRQDLSDIELQEALDKRDYIKFAKKNFLMETIPQDPRGEREYIKEWAFNLYGDLTNLSDELKVALNKKDQS